MDCLTFNSSREAKQYLLTRLQASTKIIYRQEKRGPSGKIAGQRLVAVSQKSGKKDFFLVHGARLNYFFISSSSLAAAIQVEELIEEE